MITVNTCGGIGNQLFQYAYARTFPSAQLFDNCTQYGCHIGRFNTVLPITTRPEGRWISERGLRYDPHPEVEGTCVLNGYYQCEHYFSHIADTVHAELTPRETPSALAQQYAKQIIATPNSVMVHVRHGDYLTWARERHGVLPMEYYIKAAEHFTNPNFFLFSDDPQCAMSLPHTRVQCAPHEELWLMSLCNNAIIANSSFSWWGAWLGPDRRGKVIAPKQWFRTGNEDSRDIVPERWTQL
jgi:Glycosyl transferase family 11